MAAFQAAARRGALPPARTLKLPQIGLSRDFAAFFRLFEHVTSRRSADGGDRDQSISPVRSRRSIRLGSARMSISVILSPRTVMAIRATGSPLGATRKP